MPRYGFNFLWMFSLGQDQNANPQPPDEKALDFMQEFGFDFVRIPTDYRFWTKNFDYFHPDEKVFELIDQYLKACRSRGMQMSLNLHRAPGYCINANHLERDNLWTDKIAQDAFIYLWETFAKRYTGFSNEHISFDLLNEPPSVGQYGMTRENHADLMCRTAAAIRAIDPDREIVIDGLGGGHLAMPELADLGVIHSGRGYQPMAISHHDARWWSGYADAPAPIYPGLDWEGRIWNRASLREFFLPWREVQSQGVQVHIGEMGCFNRTPNDVAMRWLTDLLGIYQEFGWGYSFWNFVGPFGIINHGRPGVQYETIQGYQVDRALLDLILECRV